jgi:hypothetical protein
MRETAPMEPVGCRIFLARKPKETPGAYCTNCAVAFEEGGFT